MNILMPQLGETVAEGKITKWFKAAGDAVKPGDNLFEIETDKVSMEVPATSAGILKEIRVRQGEVAPVSAVGPLCSWVSSRFTSSWSCFSTSNTSAMSGPLSLLVCAGDCRLPPAIWRKQGHGPAGRWWL